MQSIFESCHDISALPWWMSILGSTLLLRTVATLPVAIRQNKNAARADLLAPTLERQIESLKINLIVRAKREGKEEEETRKLVAKEIQALTVDFYKKHGISRSLMAPLAVMLVQLPLWVTISLALRNISGFVPASGIVYAPSAGVTTEGLFWCTNLSIADPYYILPAILLVSNFANIAVASLTSTTTSRIMTNVRLFTKGFVLLGCAISAHMPAAISLYWASSGVYALMQTIVLKMPKVRRLVGIAKTGSEKDAPVRDMVAVATVRWRVFVEKQKQRPWW